MLPKPQFNPCYSVETIAQDQTFLLSEREAVWLSDRLSCSLAALIDGERNIDEIIDTLQQSLLPNPESLPDPTTFFQEVLKVSIEAQRSLFEMEQKGYVVTEDNSLPPHLDIFCHHLNIAPSLAQERLRSTKVAVKTIGSVAAEDFITVLESLQIQVAEAGDLTVVLTDDYLNPQLDEFNQQALQSQSPWMLVKPVGTIVWIGPVFHPHKTGCWHCLAQRLQDNRPIAGFLQRPEVPVFPLSSSCRIFALYRTNSIKHGSHGGV